MEEKEIKNTATSVIKNFTTEKMEIEECNEDFRKIKENISNEIFEIIKKEKDSKDFIVRGGELSIECEAHLKTDVFCVC